MTDLADGTDLTVVRWRRYGLDRLYVNSSDGTRIGWVDLKTGERTLEVEERHADFVRAVAGHVSPAAEAADLDAPTDPGADSASTDPDPVYEPERPWIDLALNRPGEGVAAEAKKAFADAPVRALASRILSVHTDERAWRIGAKGESLVGKQLAKLDPDWRSIHSIPVGNRGSDIDHLAIGAGGVFTINAKHHPDKEVWVHRDTFMVDGTRTKYVRKARYEADRAQRILTEAVGFAVPVIGLIAVIGAQRGFTVKAQPRDGRVLVLERRHLAEWLGRLGPVLNADQTSAIFEQARRSTTWV